MHDGARARSRGLPAQVGRCVAFLGLVAVAGSLPEQGFAQIAASSSPLQAWEEVERTKQSKGPAAALHVSRGALREHPRFLPLVTQNLRLRTSIGGLAAARAARDSLRIAGRLDRARTAEIFLALEEGQAAVAADTLAVLSTPVAGSAEDLFHQLDRAVIASGSTDATNPTPADSLLRAIPSHPALAPPGRFAARYLLFFTRHARALLAFQQGDAEAALRELTPLAREASDQGLHDVAMRAQYAAGRLYAATGLVDEAVDSYKQAISIAERLGDDWQLAAASGWLAWTFEQQERFAEAFERRKVAAELLPPMGNPLGMGYALLGLGWDALKIGEIELAEQTLQSAVEFARQQQSVWMECQALNNLGVVHLETGRYEQAMETLQQGLDLAETSPSTQNQRTNLLNNIAILHGQSQRPDRAISIYGDLLEIHREAGNVDGQIAVLNNLALANESMGLRAQALAMYEESLELAAKSERPNDTARLNLARQLSNDDRFEEAETHLRAVIENARRRGDLTFLMQALADRGRALSYRGRFEEALAPLAAADSLRARVGHGRPRVPGLIRLAMVLSELGRWESTLQALDTAESLATRFSPTHVPTVRAIRSQTFIAMGRFRDAREQARLAIRGDVASVGIDPAGSRSVREVSRVLAIQSMLACLEEEPDPQARHRFLWETFYALQQVKSRSLLEYVQGGQRAIEPDVPDSLAHRERAARRKVDHMRSEIERMARSSTTVDSLRLALAEAQSNHERVRMLVFEADHRYRDVAMAADIDPAAVVRLLGDGVLVLDYLVSRSCEPALACDLVLFAVDKDRVEAHVVADARVVERQIGLLLDLLDSPPGHEDESLRILLAELGQSLLGPVADRLTRYEEIIIAPDGLLNRVPFSALSIPGPEPAARRRYLVELASIQTVPSLAVLHELRSVDHDSPARWDMAIWPGSSRAPVDSIAPAAAWMKPLPYAAEELEAMVSRFPRSTVLDMDLKAGSELPTQLASLGVFGHARILHFIAHGFFDDLQPWRSGLYLQSGAGGEPRKLEIADVYYLDFRSELVTLSACETAGGTLNDAVGFSGYTQALLGSGATSVLATLWSIDDASSPHFMSTFYELLSSGHSKAEALRQAQLRFLEHDALRHPFFWAPYVLVGDGSRTVELRTRGRGMSPALLLALGGALLVLSLWALQRERRTSASL